MDFKWSWKDYGLLLEVINIFEIEKKFLRNM